jgi:hypothetical protein
LSKAFFLSLNYLEIILNPYSDIEERHQSATSYIRKENSRCRDVPLLLVAIYSCAEHPVYHKEANLNMEDDILK